MTIWQQIFWKEAFSLVSVWGQACASFQQFMWFRDAEYSSPLKRAWAWSQIETVKRSGVKQAVGCSTIFPLCMQCAKLEGFASLALQSQAKCWVLDIIPSYFTLPEYIKPAWSFIENSRGLSFGAVRPKILLRFSRHNYSHFNFL